MIRLAHYFNKTILVCIPSLFEDQQPRTVKLVGIEESGLWLKSGELAELFQSPEGTVSVHGAVAAFFPFSHIAYVMPEVHPQALVVRPVIGVETRKPQRRQLEKPPKTESHRRHPGTHRKGKK